MKIYDCFMYNNEDFVLDLRLNILNKYIEKFIIIESKIDHQGNKKKLNFDIKNFKNFENKIQYYVIEDFPKNFNNWQRENYQRNFISEGIKLARDNDYIIVSDVDEIPNLKNPNNLDYLKKNKYTVFKQKNFLYKLNLINKTLPNWFGSKCCQKKHLKSPQWLRDQKVKKFSIFKFYRINWNIIEDGGWHFSYLMKSDAIQKKLKSFAHAEFNNEFYTNIERIKNLIDSKKDLFDRDQMYEKIKVDNTYPKFILENLEEFSEFILK